MKLLPKNEKRRNEPTVWFGPRTQDARSSLDTSFEPIALFWLAENWAPITRCVEGQPFAKCRHLGLLYRWVEIIRD